MTKKVLYPERHQACQGKRLPTGFYTAGRWRPDAAGCGKNKKISHGLTQPVIREIEAAIKEGVIRDIDPDLAAYGLTGLIEIMSLRLSLDNK